MVRLKGQDVTAFMFDLKSMIRIGDAELVDRLYVAHQQSRARVAEAPR